MEPKFFAIDSAAVEWVPSTMQAGVEVKSLAKGNGQTMELVRFPPNTGFPDHQHDGPEWVYMLEGSGRQTGEWLQPGWASLSESGTWDIDFVSGPEGCVLLTVYSDGA